jgi:hypothetical protein
LSSVITPLHFLRLYCSAIVNGYRICRLTGGKVTHFTLTPATRDEVTARRSKSGARIHLSSSLSIVSSMLLMVLVRLARRLEVRESSSSSTGDSPLAGVRVVDASWSGACRPATNGGQRVLFAGIWSLFCRQHRRSKPVAIPFDRQSLVSARKRQSD